MLKIILTLSAAGAVFLTAYAAYIMTPSYDGPFKTGVPELPSWISGMTGSVDLEPVGGTPPYNCYVSSDQQIPEGFTLWENCTLTGEGVLLPEGTTKRAYPRFTITINDSSNQTQSIEIEYKIVVVEDLPTLIPVGPGECKLGKYCSTQVASASGGTPPYSFTSDTFASGAPPMGMTVNLNGYLTGTPRLSGTYTFGVCVKDLVGSSDCGQTTVYVESPTTTQKKTTTTIRRTTTTQASSCSPGHYLARCTDGGTRCCLNGWVCCGGGRCAPQGYC